MTDKTKNLTKGKSKLKKCLSRNCQRESDPDKILEEIMESTREILEAKIQYIRKMTNKLKDANTISKIYWTIINYLIYDKKIPLITP